ncbi:ABC transporter ATP-binding protein [Bacillus timonensis]|uniref:ABC transporter ATP-binding protein n=1 Tax=Bacillus timonensis TaxID=1033734 RepID=A0A4V6RST2_9BACI|nr:ABC transporter ATP-binding protein [Bacillus timonensis]THE09853.1 ABC transporter ATP-binding protein [Bacillus timonensis]
MKLRVENVNFSLAEKQIIEDMNLYVSEGEFVGIIGPNGSGKSTLLKNMYRALKPDSGVIYLDGKNLFEMNPKTVAKKMGVVGQENEVPFDFKVEEIVAMGRSPYKGLFDGDSLQDQEIVAKAIKQIGLSEMKNRNFSDLSGGERQRVVLGRVLAQQTDLLLLDEPTNHLDIQHQLQIFDLIKGLGVTVLSAIHDLNLAALYCDRLYAVKDGRVLLAGTPEEVLTSKSIYKIYGVWSDVTIHPVTNKVAITFLPQSLGKGEVE